MKAYTQRTVSVVFKDQDSGSTLFKMRVPEPNFNKLVGRAKSSEIPLEVLIIGIVMKAIEDF